MGAGKRSATKERESQTCHLNGAFTLQFFNEEAL